ncbi:MAG TPA: tRNA lysidine(34) synthetase TilS [Rhodocyclaceae bacterium]|nr:tRNA lysidine(34) synthetase TilS [Rhodocyclaceae bacterium]
MASSRNSPCTDPLDASLQALLDALAKDARLSVGFSGGLDSTVLLHLAARHLGRERLSAIHVHHGLSPQADAWAESCAAVCAELGVPLQVVPVSVPRDSPEGLEAAARRLRYAAFARCAADHVLLAHHADDQAETLLFNLLRGAGVRGAAGMQTTHAGGRYLRPLLGSPRSELERYARVHGLRWIEDESNSDTAFARNYIRHAVMPVMVRRFPAAGDTLARAAEHFAEAQEMLDEMACHDLGSCTDFPVPVEILSGLTSARARNALRYLLALHGLQAPSGRRLQEVLRQFIEAAPDRHPRVELPGYRLFRARGRIELELR